MEFPKPTSTLAGLCLCLLLPLLTFGQQWQRDSIYVQSGVAGTTDFMGAERVYFQSYDDDGNPLLIVTQRRNNMGEWTNWRRRSYTYTDGELTNLLIQFWRPVEQEFDDAIEKSYTYDAEGNMLTKLVRRRSSPGMPLENNRRWAYVYDDNSNPTSRLVQEWDGTQWENLSRLTTNYNAEGQPAQQLQERWIDGNWTNSFRRGWIYNDNTGLVNIVLEQSYNTDIQEWENRNRALYQNNGVASWNSITHQSWDVDQMAWVNKEREEVQFGPGLQLENRTLSEWQEDAWQPLYQLYYTFTGSIFSLFGDSWNPNENQWDLFSRHQAVYEDGRILLDRGWQYWDDGQGDWINGAASLRRQHYWSDIMVSTETISQLESCPIPNPYRMGTPFFCEGLPVGQPLELLLTDMMGQTVYRQRLTAATAIQLNGTLPGGLYVLSIQGQNTRLHVQKLVILP
jgi:hypothetical protein